MILIINTSLADYLILSLVKSEKVLVSKKIKAERQQAEKLLLSIDNLLKSLSLKLTDLKKIQVYEKGDSFTSLRIGILTANALAYALNIPVVNTKNKAVKIKGISLVKPVYNREPNIGIRKKKNIACG